MAVELAAGGHAVVVQPAAKKESYVPDPGIAIIPAPWTGGDQELASMSLGDPRNWLVFLLYFIRGTVTTLSINRKWAVDRMVCMWVVPSGIFGLLAKLVQGIPYDVWALGSDIWKIRKVPFLGNLILRTIIRNADRVFADGIQLARDVTEITGVPCEMLSSCRKIPPPQGRPSSLGEGDLQHFLYVGRYHPNKGPDLLIEAVSLLPEQVRRSIRVHMFGFGPLEHELSRMIANLQLQDCIRLHGPIAAQDFSDYLDHVSFLVIPSRIESIPVVFSDALQIGTPVIAMPVGDLGQLIEEYGCGILAHEVTAEGLAAALLQAISCNPRSFDGGVAKAFARFSIATTVNRWLDVTRHDESVAPGEP